MLNRTGEIIKDLQCDKAAVQMMKYEACLTFEWYDSIYISLGVM